MGLQLQLQSCATLLTLSNAELSSLPTITHFAPHLLTMLEFLWVTWHVLSRMTTWTEIPRWKTLLSCIRSVPARVPNPMGSLQRAWLELVWGWAFASPISGLISFRLSAEVTSMANWSRQLQGNRSFCQSCEILSRRSNKLVLATLNSWVLSNCDTYICTIHTHYLHLFLRAVFCWIKYKDVRQHYCLSWRLIISIVLILTC